jgi:hypothetical protein
VRDDQRRRQADAEAKQKLHGRILLLAIATPELKLELDDDVEVRPLRRELQKILAHANARERLLGSQIFLATRDSPLPQAWSDFPKSLKAEQVFPDEDLSVSFNHVLDGIDRLAEERVDPGSRDFQLMLVWRSDRLVNSNVLSSPRTTSRRDWTLFFVGDKSEEHSELRSWLGDPEVLTSPAAIDVSRFSSQFIRRWLVRAP